MAWRRQSAASQRLVTVAIAIKTARTAWALLAAGETYKAAPAIRPKEKIAAPKVLR